MLYVKNDDWYEISGTCGHCGENFTGKAADITIEKLDKLDREVVHVHWENLADELLPGYWKIRIELCPNKQCRELLLSLVEVESGTETFPGRPSPRLYVYPHIGTPPRLDGEEHVPSDIVQDWQDAWVAVKTIKRSALIIRACIESILLEQRYTGETLDAMMKSAKNDPRFPENQRTFIFDNLLNFKEFGNSGAHDTEPIGDSEDYQWALDMVGRLIAMYYVEPARNKRWLDASDARKEKRSKQRNRQV